MRIAFASAEFLAWETQMYRHGAALIALAMSWYLPAEANCSPPILETVDCDPGDIYVYVEQKTVIAGDPDILVVAELLTKQGLSPSNDTPVSFFMRSSTGLVHETASSSAGLAHASLPVRPVSGPLQIWVEAGDIRSAEQRVDVVAGEPAPFSLVFEGCDTSGVCAAAAGGLSDLYGNQLTNGTVATLEVTVNRQLVSQRKVKVTHGGVEAHWDYPGKASEVFVRIGDKVAKLFVVGK